MAKRTLDELYREHGTQPAQYLDDYLREKGAHLVACAARGRQLVVATRPTRDEARRWRCGECLPRSATPLEGGG